MTKWISVTPEGDVALHEADVSLSDVAAVVGGSLEAIASPDQSMPVTFWIDTTQDEHLHFNPKASTYLGPKMWPGTRIKGVVAITGNETEEGEWLPLTEEQVTALKEILL